MNFRRATASDRQSIADLLARPVSRGRFREIVEEALSREDREYIAAVALNADGVEMITAYGMVAGTIGTGALYGVQPLSNRVTELLSFAAHDLRTLGAERVVAEFPDTDEFKPYRDVLLESGYDPAGLVEDFYSDGVAMVIFTRALTG